MMAREFFEDRGKVETILFEAQADLPNSIQIKNPLNISQSLISV